jgi:AbrB family looped-hinge helix DNA binding protein
MNTAAKITHKGQVTLPLYIRNKTGFNIGDTVNFEAGENCIIIRKSRNLLDYVGFLGEANLPDDISELLTPEVGRSILERESAKGSGFCFRL